MTTRAPGLRIVHLSTVHAANDVRILFRECSSLAAAGYEVFLLACTDAPFRHANVSVLALRRYSSRLVRMTWGATVALIKTLRLRPDIVHFHDPEFVPYALVLRLLGAKVVYDIHENLREGLYEKSWIPLKNFSLPLFLAIENFALRYFNVIFAENSYAKHYPPALVESSETVLNFPDRQIFEAYQVQDVGPLPQFFYIGGVTRARGVMQTLRALDLLAQRGFEFRFECVGPIEPGLEQDAEFQERTKRLGDRVRMHGRLQLTAGYELARHATIGLCLLQPLKNYTESFPTKLFEYMAIGLPFLTSDFPLYKELTERSRGGRAVDPTDPKAIADALQEMCGDRLKLEEMSRAGRNAAASLYSWQTEKEKLLRLYKQLK